MVNCTGNGNWGGGGGREGEVRGMGKEGDDTLLDYERNMNSKK